MKNSFYETRNNFIGFMSVSAGIGYLGLKLYLAGEVHKLAEATGQNMFAESAILVADGIGGLLGMIVFALLVDTFITTADAVRRIDWRQHEGD